MHPVIAALLIVLVFCIIVLKTVLKYKFKLKKEDNIHTEVIHSNDTQLNIIETISSASKSSSPFDPKSAAIPFENYKEKIFEKALEDYDRAMNGELSPIRKARQSKRTPHRQNKEGAKN